MEGGRVVKKRELSYLIEDKNFLLEVVVVELVYSGSILRGEIREILIKD